MEARVTPGRIVCESKEGVTIVLFAKTAKKFDAPASSIASPLCRDKNECHNDFAKTHDYNTTKLTS